MEKIIRFIKNAWLFREELSNHSGNDYSDSLLLFKRSLELISSKANRSHGESFMVQKRVSKINRAVELIDRIENSDYRQLALDKIHEEFKSSPAYNEEITFSRADITSEDINKAIVLEVLLEENDWMRLWNTLKDNKYGLRTWWF